MVDDTKINYTLRTQLTNSFDMKAAIYRNSSRVKASKIEIYAATSPPRTITGKVGGIGEIGCAVPAKTKRAIRKIQTISLSVDKRNRPRIGPARLHEG